MQLVSATPSSILEDVRNRRAAANADPDFWNRTAGTALPGTMSTPNVNRAIATSTERTEIYAWYVTDHRHLQVWRGNRGPNRWNYRIMCSLFSQYTLYDDHLALKGIRNTCIRSLSQETVGMGDGVGNCVAIVTGLRGFRPRGTMSTYLPPNVNHAIATSTERMEMYAYMVGYLRIIDIENHDSIKPAGDQTWWIDRIMRSLARNALPGTMSTPI